MASTTVFKTKQGYGYKYSDLAQIHEYLESINMRYYQYIEPCGEFDYIYTVPVKIKSDGTDEELPPRRGCRIVQATLSGKSNPAQENGSAITYARRYSLLMAFGLATEDDDGKKLEKTEEQLNKEMADSVDKDLVPHGEGMTEARIKRLRDEIKRTGNSEQALLGYYKVKSINELTEAQYITSVNQLLTKPTKGEAAEKGDKK